MQIRLPQQEQENEARSPIPLVTRMESCRDSTSIRCAPPILEHRLRIRATDQGITPEGQENLDGTEDHTDTEVGAREGARPEVGQENPKMVIPLTIEDPSDPYVPLTRQSPGRDLWYLDANLNITAYFPNLTKATGGQILLDSTN